MRLGASRHDVPDPLRGDRRRLGFIALRQPAGAGIDLHLSVQGPVADFPKTGDNGLRIGYFGTLSTPLDSSNSNFGKNVVIPAGIAGIQKPWTVTRRVNIRPTRLRQLSDQPIFEAFSQGIQPYVLDGDALLAGWAELAPPLGLSYMEPVGRPVTGAREAVLFDKGFQHKRAVTIAMQPVIW